MLIGNSAGLFHVPKKKCCYIRNFKSWSWETLPGNEEGGNEKSNEKSFM